VIRIRLALFFARFVQAVVEFFLIVFAEFVMIFLHINDVATI